jgi:hypothetical protein
VPIFEYKEIEEIIVLVQYFEKAPNLRGPINSTTQMEKYVITKSSPRQFTGFVVSITTMNGRKQ